MAKTALSNYGFVVDSESVRTSSGAQFNWDAVDAARANADGNKVVKAGTVVARQSDGQIVPRADKPVAISAASDDGADEITATATAHGLSVGDIVVIEGANEARFNGSVTVATVADANTFTYAPTDTTSAGSATGTLTASYRAWGLLITEARENAEEHALSGYGVFIGGHFFENILADADGNGNLPAAYLAELAATAGTFSFEDYADSRLV